MAEKPKQLFLEDFKSGQKYSSLPRRVTEADVLAFAGLTGDAHPIHYDEEYAKTTRFGRPIVHGLHLMALTALGASPVSQQLKDSMIALSEQSSVFQKPVFKNDTVRSEFEVEQVERQAGKDWGKVKIKVKLINQDEETVLQGRQVYRIRCRGRGA